MEKTNREFRLGITSKWPILEVRTWRDGFWHGALGVKIELPHDDMGGLWIIVTHLNPMSVPGRIEEAQKLVGAVQELGGERCVLVGDLNSLAKSDQRQYESKQVSDQMRGDAKLCRKFMQDEKIDYGVIECLENAGSLIDVGALYQRKFGGFGSSVPTMYGVDEMHAMPMRLDYIFASKDLLRHCKSCIIQNDPTTAALSDHYPVILELDFASTWLF
ncbi:Endonuclease/exonuclease/phosphatase [Phlyctochytrium arcticum]|nr:Endonuclease/exonuclease/phosphatase [Phlyctochytrium arcticum]